MTNIRVYRTNGDIFKFEIFGHSSYADDGSDIVCSAVSAIAYHTLNGLTDVVGISVGYEIKDAYFLCVLPAELEKTLRQGANVLLNTMEMSFDNLQKQYGDYITISKLEV